jgi:hypothetical protein
MIIRLVTTKLIRKMATQPAMMYYLNNQANSKPLHRIFARKKLWNFSL